MRLLLSVLIFSAVIFAVIQPAFCHIEPEQALKSNALIILRSKDFKTTKQTIADLEAAGTRVLHVFPPRTLICSMSEKAEMGARYHSNVSALHRAVVNLPDKASPMADTAVGTMAWNALINPEPETDAPEGSPLIGDIRYPEDEMLLASPESISVTAAPTTYQTSEYMIGSVAVGIILPESNGTAENWTTAREDQVISEIAVGCNWWLSRGGSKAHLTFYYDIHRAVPTQYEPIQLSSNQDNLWISETLTAIGYPGASAITQCRNYINVIRNSYGTNWSFAIFVVDSLNDSDGKFTDGYFGYAYLGGPRVVMTWDNDGWGISRMDTVTTHEMGHIFLAGDEYCSPGYACCSFGYYGYLNVYNGNCEDNNPSSVSCMMRRNSNALCQYTPGQIGWRDSDGDNIFDPEDTAVSLSANTSSTGPSFLFTGAAADIPCDSPSRSECSINIITDVSYRLDGGSWVPVPAADGAYNSTNESIGFIVGPVTEGTHLVEVKAVNSVGNSATVSKQIIFDTTAPVPPESVTDDGLTTSYTRGLSVSWSSASDPQSGIVEYQYALGTTPTDPKSGYTVSWRSAGTAQSASITNVTLTSGTTYYFYIRAKNGAGVWSASASSDGITVEPAVVSVAGAKMLPDYHLVRLDYKVVSARLYSNLFHIQDEDRTAGVWVESTTLVTPGDRVSVTGLIITSSGERKVINVTSLTKHGLGQPPVPLGLRGIDVGGGSLSPYTPGITNPHGPHNLGLLIRACGRVTQVVSGGFYIYDGSAYAPLGINIRSTAGVTVGDYVIVTGISSIGLSGSTTYPVIYTRNAQDVLKVN